VENLRRFPLTHIHAFSYSKRDGTPSATMEGAVKGDIAKERHGEITQIVAEKNRTFRTQNTLPLEVLLESGKDGVYHGYDQFFNRIAVRSNEDLIHNWVSIDQVEVGEDGNSATL